MIIHFMKMHAPLDGVPFSCKLCGYRSLSKSKWEKHLTTVIPHLIANPDSSVDYCLSSENSYRVTIGKGGDLFVEGTEEAMVSKIIDENEEASLLEENFVPDYDEEIQDTEDKEDNVLVKMKEKIEQMKKDHKRENERLLGKIRRLEDNKKRRRVFDVLDEQTPRKRIKSVIVVARR